eukprot:842227_1
MCPINVTTLGRVWMFEVFVMLSFTGSIKGKDFLVFVEFGIGPDATSYEDISLRFTAQQCHQIYVVIVLLSFDGGFTKWSMVSSDMIYPMRCIMFLNVIRFSSIMIEQRFDTNMLEISRIDNLRHRIYET